MLLWTRDPRTPVQARPIFPIFLGTGLVRDISILKGSGSGPWIPALHFFALYIIEDMFDKTNRRNLGLVKIGRTYSN